MSRRGVITMILRCRSVWISATPSRRRRPSSTALTQGSHSSPNASTTTCSSPDGSVRRTAGGVVLQAPTAIATATNTWGLMKSDFMLVRSRR